MYKLKELEKLNLKEIKEEIKQEHYTEFENKVIKIDKKFYLLKEIKSYSKADERCTYECDLCNTKLIYMLYNEISKTYIDLCYINKYIELTEIKAEHPKSKMKLEIKCVNKKYELRIRK